MKVVRTLPEEEWRRFVDEHPSGNIFHTPEMFQVFSRTPNYQPELWVTVDGSHRPLAFLLPIQIRLMRGLLQPLTSRAVAFGSVLGEPSPEGREALTLLLRTYAREVNGSPIFTELRNLSNISDLQPILHENGFGYEDHLNFLIDLQRPVEEIWRAVHSSVRTNVRKAQRMGIVIEEVTSLDKLPIFYAVLKKTYNRIAVPLAPLVLFKSAFDVLYPKHMIKFLIARLGDNYVGAAVRLLFKGTIFAWYAGAIRSTPSNKANDLLNWHILEWGAQNGFNCFDFGGAGKPNEDYGPRHFKARFSGTLVNFGRNTYIHAPIRLKLSRVGYQIARQFLWSKTHEE